MAEGPSDHDLKVYINKELIQQGQGIFDGADAEIQALIDDPVLASYTFADMISRRAQIGWSTHGHSAVDVNVYGTKGTERLHGNHENTEIGHFLRDYLDLDVTSITAELKEKLASTDWTGQRPSEDELEIVMEHSS